MLFLGAVMISAWYGGLGPGLLATALSVLCLDLFLAPGYSLGTGLANAHRLGLFVLVALLISSLNAARHRLEEALRQQDRRKDEILGVLAHELRTPLNSLATALHLLHGRQGNPMVKDEVQELMKRQVQSMARLIDDLLDVTRINQGKIHLNKEPIDLVRIVHHAVEATRPLVESRDHQLELSLPASAELEGDESRLEQVVVNLLTNAARYTDPGGRIRIAVEPANSEVLLRVKDDGIGLTADMLPRIFDLYVQGHNGSSNGLGIGLNLVQSLVTLHGGSVTAFSEGHGRGSEFVVRLPREGSKAKEGPWLEPDYRHSLAEECPSWSRRDDRQ